MRCNYCEFRCELIGENYGRCQMYAEKDGQIIERFPNMWSIGGAGLIETVPFYHIYPGSRSFVIGSASCNFTCRYCSNAYIAKEKPEASMDRLEEIPPKELVATAKKLGCANIVFNVNEPTVSLLSLSALSKEAKAEGVPMGCLTNAYMTEEAAELMLSVFSFFNVGFKGLSPEFNQSCIGIPSVKPVLRNLRRLSESAHVEIVTPIIQGTNDHEINEMAEIISGINKEIPWHIFRLLPEAEMKGENYPGIEAVNNALMEARQKLPYLYFHNFVGSDWVDTLCPECGAAVIERISLGCGGDKLKKVLCDEGRCPECGANILLIEKKIIETEVAIA